MDGDDTRCIRHILHPVVAMHAQRTCLGNVSLISHGVSEKLIFNIYTATEMAVRLI